VEGGGGGGVLSTCSMGGGGGGGAPAYSLGLSMYSSKVKSSHMLAVSYKS
jgi:hypothetical protein